MKQSGDARKKAGRRSDGRVGSVDLVYYLDCEEAIKEHLEGAMTLVDGKAYEKEDERYFVNAVATSLMARGLLQLATNVGIERDSLYGMFVSGKSLDAKEAMPRIASELGVPLLDPDRCEEGDESKMIEGMWDTMNIKSVRWLAADTGFDRDVLVGMLGSSRLPTHVQGIVRRVVASIVAPIRKSTEANGRDGCSD
jgi:DNA-binding phage protein